MKFSILAWNVLACVAAVVAQEPPPEETTTTVLILNPSNRLAGGVTYVETFDMNMTTTFTVMGQSTLGIRSLLALKTP